MHRLLGQLRQRRSKGNNGRHLVFSTQERRPSLSDQPLRESLHAYFGSVSYITDSTFHQPGVARESPVNPFGILSFNIPTVYVPFRTNSWSDRSAQPIELLQPLGFWCFRPFLQFQMAICV